MKHFFLCLLLMGVTAFAGLDEDAVVERSPTATEFAGLIRADFGIWYDPARWRLVKDPSDPFVLKFRHVSGKLVAVVSAVRETLPEEDMVKITIQHGRAIARDYRLVTQARRIALGGKKVLFLSLDGTFQSEMTTIYGYFYTGPEGMLQIEVFVASKFADTCEEEAESFLNGIQIGTSGIVKTPKEESAMPGKEASTMIPVTPGSNVLIAQLSSDTNVAAKGILPDGDPARAAAALKAKSDEGNMAARVNLALYYAEGFGVEKDAGRAVELMKQAAATHLASAEVILGMWYYNGYLVPKDAGEAQRLFRSADEGNPFGQTWLGATLYESDPKTAAELYLKAATHGCRTAEYMLALCFRDGKGVAKDDAQKMAWMKKAAALEYAPAQEEMAGWYLYGEGGEKNPAEAVKIFRAMAMEGMANGENNLGACLWKGEGVEKNREEAMMWLQKAAEQGHMEAARFLGNVYWTGDGVEKNPKTAIIWYERAAKLGSAEAEFYMGLALQTGVGAAKDEAAADGWYRKAADQGHPRAMAVLGSQYHFGKGVPKNDEEAVKLYTKAAELKDSLGEVLLADSYSRGNGVEKDQVKAFQLYLAAAEQGNVMSQLNAGIYLTKGIGVEKNLDEAMKWLRKAADNDNPYAEFQLGLFYERGNGVAVDNEEAARLFRFSAIQGNPYGENAFGYHLATGEGTKQDLVEAYKWYVLAMSQDEAAEPKSRAEVNMKAIVPQMTPEQIEEGKKRASEFVPKHKQQDDSELPSFGLG